MSPCGLRVLALLGLIALGCEGQPSGTEAPAPARDVCPLSAPEHAALEGPARAEPEGIELLVPAEGTVIPWTFPSVRFSWDDRRRANAFRVRCLGEAGQVLAEAISLERGLRLPNAEWTRLKEQVGEGGAFRVEVVGASVMPDGAVLWGPVAVHAGARFSAEGEHPTGEILYSWKARPLGSNPGPSFAYRRDLFPMRVDMQGHVTQDSIQPVTERVFQHAEREAYVDLGLQAARSDLVPRSRRELSVDMNAVARADGVPAHDDLPDTSRRNCVGCHTTSTDGRYIAAVGYPIVDGTTVPEETIVSSMGVFFIRQADHQIVRQIPGGFGQAFHPTDPALVLYSLQASETGIAGRLVFRADLHVLNLDTGEDRLVPGASEPDDCELLAAWHPSGESIVFSRAPRGAPCDAHFGLMDLVTLPWNDGAGGEPRGLPLGLDEPGSNNQARYSPDGRWIVFYRTQRGFREVGSGDLWVVPAQGGVARRLGISTDAMESLHAFSPDGRWLAFQSNRDRVDQIKGYVSRFHEDGTTAPAIPLPGAGDWEVSIVNLDWMP